MKIEVITENELNAAMLVAFGVLVSLVTGLCLIFGTVVLYDPHPVILGIEFLMGIGAVVLGMRLFIRTVRKVKQARLHQS